VGRVAKKQIADAQKVASVFGAYQPGDRVIVKLLGKNGRFYQRPATVTHILGGLGPGVTARLDKPLGSVLATDFPLKDVQPL
jgi:hypothetical protein